jgi:PQQ-dependent dehydrogenase (methanol/ethanol family)
MLRAALAALIAACLPLGLAAAPKAAQVDTTRLLNADREPGQWLAVGRTYDEQRYSPLTQINTGNVTQLGLAWHYDLDTNRGQEASPIVIDGVLYVTSAWSKLFAFNAKTGKLLWKYDPQVSGAVGIKGCCDVVNRGVAAWKGRIYLGAYDGRLIALNAKSGKVVWSVQTADSTKAYTSTGAPRIANGKVIIGNAGSELGVRGYVSAFDAVDGRLLWRFYTIPGNPALPYENEQMRAAAATWTGDLYWKLGGATAWDGLVYEPKTNLVYFGTANGTPWVAEARSPQGGDNLFTNSIIAVDADTGHYAWHYQVTPAETWDYDATSPLMLADLTIDGAPRRVLLQVSKNGFFYALDAATGQLLRAKNYTAVSWATGIDMSTGRPIEVPEARFGKTGKAVVVQPSGQGAHSWHPMAFSRRTNLIYTPMVETSQGFAPDPNYRPREGAANAGTGRAPPSVYEGVHVDVPRTSRAFLIAWDPVATREVWRSELRGTIASGVLATAGGLVFQGSQRGEFTAYRDADGLKLWSTDPQTGVVAAPISYGVDGQQYIAVLAGYGTRDYYAGNNSRLLVYALHGKASLPPLAALPPPRALNPPPQFGTAEQIERGGRVYNDNCTMCHDTAYGNRGLFPDLRYSPLLNSAEAFRSVVIDGVLTPRGMVSFRERFGVEEAEAVRAYIIQRAHQGLPTRPAQ